MTLCMYVFCIILTLLYYLTCAQSLLISLVLLQIMESKKQCQFDPLVSWLNSSWLIGDGRVKLSSHHGYLGLILHLSSTIKNILSLTARLFSQMEFRLHRGINWRSSMDFYCQKKLLFYEIVMGTHCCSTLTLLLLTPFMRLGFLQCFIHRSWSWLGPNPVKSLFSHSLDIFCFWSSWLI